jgi:hypothetical protein
MKNGKRKTLGLHLENEMVQTDNSPCRITASVNWMCDGRFEVEV